MILILFLVFTLFIILWNYKLNLSYLTLATKSKELPCDLVFFWSKKIADAVFWLAVALHV